MIRKLTATQLAARPDYVLFLQSNRSRHLSRRQQRRSQATGEVGSHAVGEVVEEVAVLEVEGGGGGQEPFEVPAAGG